MRYAEAMQTSPQSEQENEQQVIAATRAWLQAMVIDLNLCPFARRPLQENKVRFSVSTATEEADLLADLERELELLADSAEIETTLLMTPRLVKDFDSYNQFLNPVDELIELLDFRGVFQVASFHPLYQFYGTQSEDAENYSNRSPFPTLHLLREDSLEHVIAAYPDTGEIPERNIEKMREIGIEQLRTILSNCSG